MTITTAEVRNRIDSLNAAPFGSDDFTIGLYQTKEIEAEWKLWLYQDAAADLSTEASDLIFQKAWEEGHASGYEEVDNLFRELVELIRSVNELGIKSEFVDTLVNNGEFEYTQSSDCDGSNQVFLRRLPKKIIEPTEWEKTTEDEFSKARYTEE